MKVTKRVFSCFLAVLMLLSFAACADDSGPKDPVTTKGPDSVTTAPKNDNGIVYEEDDLPATLNFGGEKVFVLSTKIYDSEGKMNRLADFSVEELTSDVINDSIYNRELFVEERLGIEIINIMTDTVAGEIEKQYSSQDDSYDVIIYPNHNLALYVLNGYFTDLYAVDHLNFDKPWWSSKFNAEAELEDMLFMSTGSLSLSLTRNIFAMYYNKTLAESYSGSYPELSDLYTVVENGDWTFDKFVELGGGIYKDINGDNAYDIDDEYGIAYVPYVPLDAIWSAFDINIFSRTEDGWFEMDVNTDKLYTALDKVYTLIHNTQGSISSGKVPVSFSGVHETFANGHILFMPTLLDAIESAALRNMQDDYGILPFPKYDKAQKEYYSFSYDQFTAFAIPICSSRPNTAGAMLEAMASYAYRDTQPAYFDIALKGRYMSDPQSRKMLDLVIDGFMVDAAWIYLGNLAAGYPPSFRSMISSGDQSFATNHQKLSKKVSIYLKSYKSDFDKIMG
ncbi:MAG: hypothetical protein IKV54_00405 [Clostridia bacterium]|nr:hypothetical protein [Clostridia bacterium]